MTDDLVKECDIYLKPGETPRQRMDRDHKDMQIVLRLWADDKNKLTDMVNIMQQCEWALDASPCFCIKKGKHRATCARCATLTKIRDMGIKGKIDAQQRRERTKTEQVMTDDFDASLELIELERRHARALHKIDLLEAALNEIPDHAYNAGMLKGILVGIVDWAYHQKDKPEWLDGAESILRKIKND